MIEFKQSDLVKAFNLILPVLSDKVIPVLGMIRIKTTMTEVYLFGTNCITSICCTVKHHKTDSFDILIPGEKIKKLLDQLTETVSFSVDQKKNELLISSSVNEGKYLFKYLDPGEIEYPDTINKYINDYELFEEKRTLFINSSDLKKGLEFVNFAKASSSEIRVSMTGVLLHIKKDKLNFVATNGHKLAVYSIDRYSEDTSKLILPATAVNVILQLLQENINLELKYCPGRGMYFKMNDIVFETQFIKSKYGDYEAVIPEQFQISALVGINDFKQAIKRVSVIVNEHRRILFNYRENSLEIISSYKEKNNITIMANEYVPAVCNKQIEIGFSKKYILEMIHKFSSANNMMVQMIENNKITKYSNENVNGEVYLMPQRLEENNGKYDS